MFFSFPNLIWSGRVLTTMLDILQLLSRSLEVVSLNCYNMNTFECETDWLVSHLQDPTEKAPIFQVPNTPYTLRTEDSISNREVCDTPSVHRHSAFLLETCVFSVDGEGLFVTRKFDSTRSHEVGSKHDALAPH